MIAQHKLLRMRIEIDLITNVAHVKDLDVVLDQRERDNQGREPVMIIADHAQQLRFLVSAEPLLEISQDVLEHVHMFAHRRFHGQGLPGGIGHESEAVGGAAPFREDAALAGRT